MSGGEQRNDFYSVVKVTGVPYGKDGGSACKTILGPILVEGWAPLPTLSQGYLTLTPTIRGCSLVNLRQLGQQVLIASEAGHNHHLSIIF